MSKLCGMIRKKNRFYESLVNIQLKRFDTCFHFEVNSCMQNHFPFLFSLRDCSLKCHFDQNFDGFRNFKKICGPKLSRSRSARLISRPRFRYTRMMYGIRKGQSTSWSVRGRHKSFFLSIFDIRVTVDVDSHCGKGCGALLCTNFVISAKLWNGNQENIYFVKKTYVNNTNI